MGERQSFPKENKFNLLKFLGIMGFELVFVSALLLLFFGTLNYFNIFPISDTFPKYFGWLPRQTAPQKKISYTLSPTPTAFQYDATKAKASLNQYIAGNIKKEFLPKIINVNQRQSVEGGKSDLPYEFSWYYPTATSSISANLHFIKNTNRLDGQLIFMEINSSQLKEENVTADSANNILNLYLKGKTAMDASNCKTVPSASYCQIFTQNDIGKEGYGIILYKGRGVPLITKPHLILFSCFFAKEGNLYKTQESCLKGY